MNTTRFGSSVGTASGSGLPTGDDDLSALVRVHVWGYPRRSLPGCDRT